MTPHMISEISFYVLMVLAGAGACFLLIGFTGFPPGLAALLAIAIVYCINLIGQRAADEVLLKDGS